MWLSLPKRGRGNLTILLQLEHIEFKSNCLTANTLLCIAVCSVQARKRGYSEYSIQSRSCSYTKPSGVPHYEY